MSEERDVKEEGQEELATFEWDTADNLELFGEPVDETKLTEEEKKTVEEDEEEPKKKPVEELTEEEKLKEEEKKKLLTKEKEEKKEEEKVEFFTKPTEDEPEEQPAGVGEKVLSIIASELKEQGIFSSVEIPEGDLTEEQFVSLQEQEIENRIQETFEGFFEEMDEDGKAFLKFKKEGGKTSEFFDVVKNTSGYPTGDIETEVYQRRIARFHAEKIEGLDIDEAQEKVDWLEQNGKLDKYARRYDEKVRKLEASEKQRLEDSAVQLAKDREDGEKEFAKTIKSTLDETDEIKKFTISKKEKAELLGYITKPSVKVGKNRFLTGLQSDLNKLSQNPESLVLLAKLLRTDFDTSNLSTKIETETTKDLKKNIQRAQQNIKPSTSGSTKGRSLSDFFSDAPD